MKTKQGREGQEEDGDVGEVIMVEGGSEGVEEVRGKVNQYKRERGKDTKEGIGGVSRKVGAGRG